MRKINCFIITSIFTLNSLFAQDPALDNLQKYWYYRYRLKNDFLVVGSGQGMSIPATTRMLNGLLYFGDGAASDLGWYIGMLAAEYKLLKDNSQPTDTTVKELYYALEAFNRLDNNAESYLRCDCANPVLPPPGDITDLNGFFIRDDIPDDFISPYNPQNYFSHFNQGITSIVPVSSVESSISPDINSIAEDYNSYESTDQLIHVLLGLSLVNKCIDDPSLTYNGNPFLDGETSILTEAHNIAYRMVMYMKNGGSDNWKLDDPVNGNFIGATGNGVLLSYGIAEAACKVTDKDDNIHALTGKTCNAYHNFTTTLNEPVFETLQFPLILAAITPSPSSYNDHLIGLLAAMGNSWYLCTPLGIPISFAVNTTNVNLSAFFTTFHEREYIPLLRQVLHEGANGVPNDSYTILIDEGPCGGPYNFGSGAYPTYQWSTPNRFRDPEQRGTTNPPNPGEYVGLDYMLLYNLYSIAQPDEVAAYFNLMDRTITSDFPTLPFPHVGSKTFPIEIDAFNTITATNHIKAGGTPSTDGDVTYRAGQEIAMLPGFGVEEGAEFGAIVEPFHCVNGDYVRMAGDSGKPREIYTAPTSYVYYTNASETPRPKNFSGNTFSPAASNVKPLIQTEPSISIIPNPSAGIFTFMSEDALQNIEIRDVLGNIVFKKTVNNQPINMDVDLSSRPRGIYFLKVQTAEKIYTEKIILQ